MSPNTPPGASGGALAIIAALPRELDLLARDLGAVVSKTGSRRDESKGLLLQTASMKDGSCPMVLATAGMGAERVSLAVAAVLAHGPIATLLSVGFAGACDPSLNPGDVIEASLVIDSRSGERFPTDAAFEVAAPGVLVSSTQIAGIAEKRRLRATYNAAAVDMEAATVARLARAHGIPFGTLKAISDEHDVDLTALSTFTDVHGHFRTSAFALHTLLRPGQWRAAARLGRNSKSALQNLTHAVHQLIVKRVTRETS